MNARIEPLQLAATPTIASLTKPWLQRLYGLNHSTAPSDVSDGVLQDLLMQCRLELSGVFSRDDLFVLLNSAFKSHYDPIDFERLASDICHDLGIELDDYRNTRIGPLVDKLLSLSKEQSVALSDALWQTQQTYARCIAPAECWKALGIELTAV